jgi:hypothetical protein
MAEQLELDLYPKDDNLIRWMTENWDKPRPPDTKNPPGVDKLLKRKCK